MPDVLTQHTVVVVNVSGVPIGDADERRFVLAGLHVAAERAMHRFPLPTSLFHASHFHASRSHRSHLRVWV